MSDKLTVTKFQGTDAQVELSVPITTDLPLLSIERLVFGALLQANGGWRVDVRVSTAMARREGVDVQYDDLVITHAQRWVPSKIAKFVRGHIQLAREAEARKAKAASD